MAFMHSNDLVFKLNGTSFDGLQEITLPKIGKQLRAVTVIGDVQNVYESSKLAVDDDFSVTCRYVSGSVPQRALVNHLFASHIGAAVSASSFIIAFDTGFISGTCLPMPIEWGNTTQGVEAPTAKYNFKLQSITTASF